MNWLLKKAWLRRPHGAILSVQSSSFLRITEADAAILDDLLLELTRKPPDDIRNHPHYFVGPGHRGQIACVPRFQNGQVIGSMGTLPIESSIHRPSSAFVNRIVGGLQVVWGIGEAVAGIGVAGGGGTVIGGAIAIHGADNVGTGFIMLWTGEDRRTQTSKAFDFVTENSDQSDKLETAIFLATDLAAMRNLAKPSECIAPVPCLPSNRIAASDKVEYGKLFNRLRKPKYPYNEVYVENPAGGYFILDSYNPATGEIVSRKFAQLADTSLNSAIAYLREAARKYPPGATIANVPSSGVLAGQKLQGSVYLEVPIQTMPIPQRILDAAKNHKVRIRDIEGRVFP
jgi:hypothetical protein